MMVLMDYFGQILVFVTSQQVTVFDINSNNPSLSAFDEFARRLLRSDHNYSTWF